MVADPFSMASNTTWNANGYVNTSVVTPGMQVRVGGKYSGYAYYGGETDEGYHQLFAINLATAAETPLGDAGTLTGVGVRMVLERVGYLYVEVFDLFAATNIPPNASSNEFRIYNMTSATSLGSLYTTYTKEFLDPLLEDNPVSQPIWGLDLPLDGSRIVMGTKGKAFELGALLLTIIRSGPDVILSWPGSITAVIQSSPSLSPPSFSDLDPQPAVVVSGNMNTATIPLGSADVFYRLREQP